ncbi:MAG: hypothetical protein IT305_23360 [Chloroflexi bacterium]|nr:hypothetical protein [Chloroflexota bacterium]
MHPLIASLYAAVLQFAAGSLLATVASDTQGEVTPGFLRQGALAALVGALLGWLLVGEGQPAEHVTALALLLLAVVYLILTFTGRLRLRRSLGWLAVLVGGVGLVLAAVARPSPSMGPNWTALASVASALALGASVVGLILGHWYLVTPRLSARPLRLLCDVAVVALIVLSGFALWYVLERPAATAFGPDTPWFRWTGFAAVSLVPIGITVAARVCCQEWPRGRAIQAATGLLYITAAMVLAGALAGNMVLLTG